MENNANSQKVNVLYVVRVFFGYWPLLLLSVVLFAIGGILYLRFASKTYRVYGRIAIKTEQLRSSGGTADAYINVNDLMNQEKNFTNEVAYLSSTPLIKEVIEDMNLFTSYYIKEDKIPKELPFSFINIYKKSPFMVIVDENSIEPMHTFFYIRILNDKQFVLSANEKEAFLYNTQDESVSTTPIHFAISGVYKFGDVIRNRYCSFKVVLNANYNPDVYQGKDLFFKFNSPQALAYKFQKKLTVATAFYKSSIADLTFEGENLKMSEEFLKNLIDKYIQKNLEKKNYNADNTIAYIENQLASISGSLGQSEQRLQNFRSSKDLMNIKDKTTNLSDRIQELERNRTELQTLVQNLERLKDYINDSKNSSTFIAPSFTGISDPTLASLIDQLTTLSTERQNLISTNQTKNPRIKTIDANMATIMNVILENINFSLKTTQNELNEVTTHINKLYKEFSSLPRDQQRLLGLEREYNINDAVYTSLLDKRIEAKLIKASNLPDCEIIEPVHYVEVASPNPKKVGMLAIFFGLFFPSIYIVVVNFLTQRIWTKEQLSNFCKLPNMGDIPHNEKAMQNVISNLPQSPIVERFHSIRTNLIYYLFGETHKCILVTSSLPNEGKSFMSLNLALSFAATNNRTLLINFDLRKKSKTLDELKFNALVGIDAYLINRATIEDIILQTPYPNLDFIHNGQTPPDPVALLSSPRLKELFEIVKSDYDYIIIDTPPFGMVTDAFILMQYADISLYVSRLGTVTKRVLKQSMEELHSKDVEKVYMVRNDLSKIDKTYADKYAYGNAKKNWFSRTFKRHKK